MAVADVYHARLDFEMPSGPASVNLHYQETTPPSSLDGPDALAQGIVTQQQAAIQAMLSADCAFSAVQVYKKAVLKELPAFATFTDGVGGIAGVALPAQNGLKIGLLQTFWPSRSNGMIWFPGVPRSRVTTSIADTAYLNTEVKAWTDLLVQEVAEPAAGDGRFRLVVVSRKHLVANPGDWVGAAADVTGITRFPIIGRQKRRRTKVRGGSTIAL